ncbi:MAG: TonB family protein [Pseudomonadota bacterium]
MSLKRIKNYLFGLSPLAIMLLVSAYAHILLIVFINFEPPALKFLKDKMPALDVVLVNAKTKSKPTKADALAQANLNRGGNTDEKRQLKSALPPPKTTPRETTITSQIEAQSSSRKANQADTEAERKQQKIAELEKQIQQMMTQVNSQKKIDTSANRQEATPKPEKNQQDATTRKVGTADLLASSLEMARLEAQISKQQDDYQNRPKRKYIGARTQEYRFAAYVESWRQKVEKIGNLNYPEAAKDKGLYGQLRMTVSIRSDGSIESVEIDRSSGHKVLDDAAERIVRMAAPYAPFPEDIRKDTDILGITRTWTFTKEDSLATE